MKSQRVGPSTRHSGQIRGFFFPIEKDDENRVALKGSKRGDTTIVLATNLRVDILRDADLQSRAERISYSPSAIADFDKQTVAFRIIQEADTCSTDGVSDGFLCMVVFGWFTLSSL